MNGTPPKSLLRHVGRAITDDDMSRSGDRILLALSGGKDSLTLLHALLYLQRYLPIRSELGVITVDSAHADETAAVTEEDRQ